MCPGNDRNGYYIGCLAIIADPQFGLLKPDQRDWSVEETLLSNTIKAINSSREQPDFVAFVGDLTHAEPFTIAKQLQIQDFMRCVSSLRTRPFFLCGNHDIGDQPTLDSLQAYRQTFGADYFVVDHFESKFIFLNSQLFFGYQDLENESLKQWLWLKEQCEMVYMYPYRHVVVLQHVPPFIETANEAPMRVRSSNMTFNLPVLEQRLRLLSELRLEPFRVFNVIGAGVDKSLFNLLWHQLYCAYIQVQTIVRLLNAVAIVLNSCSLTDHPWRRHIVLSCSSIQLNRKTRYKDRHNSW
uniref:Metallophos domain-containing protein n=1 Tax=Trichuris muris TaxID=70415 RepID=A0A5S6QFE4_TRIMR